MMALECLILTHRPEQMSKVHGIVPVFTLPMEIYTSPHVQALHKMMDEQRLEI